MNTSEATKTRLSKSDRARLLELYRTMSLIRQTEQRLTRLFADSEVPGFIHLSIGQEAVASGVCSAMQDEDSLATTHRGHGHVLARGLDAKGFFKEIMGRYGGLCRGRGGSMHVADLSKGILGANGIVGAGIPIALGSAMAHSVRKTGGVAVVFFGDGAMAEGVLHETINLASLWNMPLLLVCENNGWSEFSPTSRQFTGDLAKLAGAFGVSHKRIDGNDALLVSRTTQRVIADVRKGKGPYVLECMTYRVRGHFEGDPQKYRDPEDIESAQARDPLKAAELALLASDVSQQVLDDINQQVASRIETAVEEARADREPDFAAAFADVYTQGAVS